MYIVVAPPHDMSMQNLITRYWKQ